MYFVFNFYIHLQSKQKQTDMTFEILDNRKGEWEAGNTRECKYFVRAIETDRIIGVSCKAFAKEIIKDWQSWDFGQYADLY